MNVNYNNLLVKANLIAWLKGIASAERNTFMKQSASEISNAINDNGAIPNKAYYNDFYNKYQTKITGQSGVYSVFSLISGTHHFVQ